MERTKPEIKRDYEYLLRLWDEIRELTLHSTRAGADLRGRRPDQALDARPLHRDIEEVLVEGETGYRVGQATS